ncbi:hypothetical protein SNK03_008617 [Fusarium graminearum]
MGPYNSLTVLLARELLQLRGHSGRVQILGIDLDFEDLLNDLLDSNALLLLANPFCKQHEPVTSNFFACLRLSQGPAEQVSKCSKTIFLFEKSTCLTKS